MEPALFIFVMIDSPFCQLEGIPNVIIIWDRSSRRFVSSGTLLEDMSPPIMPAREIPDPNDSKPEDWDDRERIEDPDSVKPDDWDESAPAKIPDAR